MRTVKGIAIVVSSPKNQNYAADSNSFAGNLGNQPITSKCRSYRFYQFSPFTIFLIKHLYVKFCLFLAQLKDSNNRSTTTIKKLSIELKDFKERLTNTNSELCNMDVSSRLFG